jgi:Uncharacterized integral membrane protein (DUF2301)
VLWQARGRGAVLCHTTAAAGPSDRVSLQFNAPDCITAYASVYATQLVSQAARLTQCRTCRWVPPVGQRALLVTFMVLFSIFAARKYTQPVKDDLGDKSVRACCTHARLDLRSLWHGIGGLVSLADAAGI